MHKSRESIDAQQEDVLTFKINIKAIDKIDGEIIYVRPVFFAWHVGIHYKIVKGIMSGSLFCRTASDLIFPRKSKAIILFIKSWYWITNYAYMQLFKWIPARVKNKLSRMNYKSNHTKNEPFN